MVDISMLGERWDLVRDIKHLQYLRKATEQGWIPPDIPKIVNDNLRQIVEHTGAEQLSPVSVTGALDLIKQDSRALMACNNLKPLSNAEERDLTVTIDQQCESLRFFKRSRRAHLIQRMYAASTNPYERLQLLRIASQNAKYHKDSVLNPFIDWVNVQDTIVSEVLPIAGIEALQGNYEGAIDLLEKLIDEHYVSWSSRVNCLVNRIGYTYLLKGDFVRAECTFKEVQRRSVWYLEGDEGTELYNHQLALTYLLNGDVTKAKRAFEKAVECLPIQMEKEYTQNYQQLCGAVANQKYELRKLPHCLG
ncbi:hypothetical protein HZB02_05195 [Candidatus Woesearchaeota archaeon]|nr:hypothetical protein [Candidatus Woesearchaeota archaeon]